MNNYSLPVSISAKLHHQGPLCNIYMYARRVLDMSDKNIYLKVDANGNVVANGNGNVVTPDSVTNSNSIKVRMDITTDKVRFYVDENIVAIEDIDSNIEWVRKVGFKAENCDSSPSVSNIEVTGLLYGLKLPDSASVVTFDNSSMTIPHGAYVESQTEYSLPASLTMEVRSVTEECPLAIVGT